MLEPILQDQAYHRFADTRALFGIANAADVLSNVAFLIVGTVALFFLWRERRGRERFVGPDEMRPYWVLFAAVAATAAGSGYYHLAPDDSRLVWDRLPMAVGFMAFVCAVIGERVSVRLADALLIPLASLGMASVAFWAVSGDLRPYLLVQFGSIAAVLVVAALYRSRYSGGGIVFVAVGLYVLAKFAESYDRPLFELTRHAMSGHTLKHLLAAAALWVIYRSLARRTARKTSPRLTSAACR